MRKIYKKAIWSIVMLLVIMLSNNIDTFYTNKLMEIVEKTVSYDFKLNDARLVDLRKAITSFNITTESKEYITPIEGTLYKKFSENHQGIDVLVYEEFVKAINYGEVIKVDEKKDGIKDGIEVVISHGEITAVYSNIEKSNVSKGEKVMKGHIIGSMGDISKKDKYFYFEIWKDDIKIDPLEYIKTNNKTPLSYE